jgi:uncharacterized protein YqeY
MVELIVKNMFNNKIMGVLIKELNARLAGYADGKTISRIIKTKL